MLIHDHCMAIASTWSEAQASHVIKTTIISYEGSSITLLSARCCRRKRRISDFRVSWLLQKGISSSLHLLPPSNLPCMLCFQVLRLWISFRNFQEWPEKALSSLSSLIWYKKYCVLALFSWWTERIKTVWKMLWMKLLSYVHIKIVPHLCAFFQTQWGSMLAISICVL